MADANEYLDHENLPSQSDKLFDRDLAWKLNAQPGEPHGKWWLVADGFEIAADQLARHALTEELDQDTFVYPLVFLYRHAIETRIKDILDLNARLSGQATTPLDTHSVHKLWNKALPIIQQRWPRSDRQALTDTERLLQEFNAADPGSYTFRYPVDTKGAVNVYPQPLFSLGLFVRSARRILNLLSGVALQLGEDLDHLESAH